MKSKGRSLRCGSKKQTAALGRRSHRTRAERKGKKEQRTRGHGSAEKKPTFAEMEKKKLGGRSPEKPKKAGVEGSFGMVRGPKIKGRRRKDQKNGGSTGDAVMAWRKKRNGGFKKNGELTGMTAYLYGTFKPGKRRGKNFNQPFPWEGEGVTPNDCSWTKLPQGYGSAKRAASMKMGGFAMRGKVNPREVLSNNPGRRG